MLTSLSIKNYALIDDLHVNFSNGMTIITGETGAGKSILLGGLSLILGKRADLSAIKDTTKKCVIEATFDIASHQLKPVFKANGLDYESQTILRREILPSGKSRAFINDTPVVLESMQILGKHLIDIHSQHQTLELTNNDFQFQVIDALAKNKQYLDSYALLLSELKLQQAELKRLQDEKVNAIKELDYNTFLYNELETANLISGELEALESEYETLNNIEDIQERLSNAYQLIRDDEHGILNRLLEVKQQLMKVSDYATEYNTIYNRVDSSLIEIDDIVSEIESINDGLQANPDRLQQVNTKLQTIHNLLQKHVAANIDELIVIRDALKIKINVSENLDAIILKKQQDIQTKQAQLNEQAIKIHNNRVDVIPGLIDQLQVILTELGMSNARFNIEIVSVPDFLSNGKDDLHFLFSANKGGEFKPLKKAASGGELSRIMLAIKSILSKFIQLPAIMFDEIDTGVSGEVSNKIANIMQQMSQNMQVFTITHLPQIAAKGDTHFKVYKEDVNNVTETKLKRLNQDDRIVEIAQMLGGSDISTSAIAHAKQLLN